MGKITKEDALRYHAEGKPGKIEVIPTKPYSTQTDLSFANDSRTIFSPHLYTHAHDIL